MPWFKVDDGLAFSMKAITAGNQALGLWVRAGSWSMHQLSDGFIPESMVAALGGKLTDARALEAAGLWRQVPGGWVFHDWDVYQPSKEKVLKDKAEAAERMARVRANVRANNPRTNGDGSASPSRPTDLTKTSTRQSPLIAGEAGTDPFDEPEVTARLAARHGISLWPVAEHVRAMTGLVLDANQTNVVSEWLLHKAPSWPSKPQSYVLSSITRNPHEIAQFIHEQGMVA